MWDGGTAYTQENSEMLKQSIYSTSIFNLEINFKKVRTPIQSFKQVIVYRRRLGSASTFISSRFLLFFFFSFRIC